MGLNILSSNVGELALQE